MSRCIYCEAALVRFEAHPSWSVCPKHDRGLFERGAQPMTFYEKVLGHDMDMRGAPNR